VTLALTETATVRLDTLGRGSVKLGPRRQNIRWSITSVAVTNDGTSHKPLAIVYVGNVGTANQYHGTYSGNSDRTDADITLYSGEYITVEWTGGDVNSLSEARITLTEDRDDASL
jgi:hypothetical protein